MASQHKSYDDRTGLLLSSHCQSNAESLDFQRLNYEEERIKSFASWPVHYPVDPGRLAKAGFYYTGIEDEVICFSCHGHIKNWDYGDIVLKKHSELYPNCDFIKKVSNNVPLLKTSGKFITQSSVVKDVDSINKNCSTSDAIDFNKMKSESERLKTFYGKWPLSFINTAELAYAGFFYTGIDDKVQCFFCKGIKGNWELGSIPVEEHLKHFPWCDYLYENVLKVKKGSSWFQSSSQDVCGNTKQIDSSSNRLSSDDKLIENNHHQTNLEDLGVHLYKSPSHPQQASLMARLRSFASWPSDSPVSKEDMAAAGFFYIGIGDRTICFHCNGGLCKWEDGDDPWVEHARWFSTCNFLLLNKGSDFIKSCLASNPSKMLRENVSYQNYGQSTTGLLLKKVDEAMESNLVKYVLDTEIFPLYIVRAAVLLQIKQTGNNFTNVDDLCVAASYLKDEMENQSFDVGKPLNIGDLNIRRSFSENCTISDAPGVINNVCSSPANSSCSSNENKQKNDNPEKSNFVADEDELKDNYLCKICMDNEVGFVFLPCGHLPACTICAPALKHCPMCRKPIQAIVRCYLN